MYIVIKCIIIVITSVIIKVFCVKNEESIEINKEYIQDKLGSYNVNMTSLELQKKIQTCSLLINRIKKKLILHNIKNPNENLNLSSNDFHEEQRSIFINMIIEINHYCNAFINLIILIRISKYKNLNKFFKICEISDKEFLNKKLEEIIENININESNASFFRSLIIKTKCDNFLLNNACKKLTNKLLYYLATLPKETIENFDNIVFKD